MIRRKNAPRADHRDVVAREGMLWASGPVDGVEVEYWRDDAHYVFTPAEIARLETATDELWQMCVHAARWMLTHVPDARLGLPDGSARRLLTSLDAGDPGSHARFDLCLDADGVPRMFEINGDTPTMLLESAVSQWSWHETLFPDSDQWNSVHERLVGAWARRVAHGQRDIHFTGLLDLVEEAATLAYLADTAAQAGATTSLFDLRDLGFDVDARCFVDGESQRIATCYKLYPWEDMLREPFGSQVESSGVTWVEPLWRQALSNKALLAALWQCYPGLSMLYKHHCILPLPHPSKRWIHPFAFLHSLPEQ